MSKFGLLLLALATGCLSRLAAQPKADSILVSLGFPAADTAAVLALYDSAYELELSDPQFALQLYRKGIRWSETIGYLNGAGKGLNYSGIVHFNLGQIDSAIACARASLPYFEKAGNPLSYAASLNNIGNGHNVRNDYTEAIRYYQRANAVYDSLGEEQNIIFNLNNIGNMLNRSGNYSRAEQYLLDALQRAEAIGFTAGLADASNNLGSLYQTRKQYQKALPYFRDALRYYHQTREANYIALGLSNLGQHYHITGDDKSALHYLQQARAMLDTLGLPREKASVLTNLSITYNSLGEYARAAALGQEALPLVQELGDLLFEKRLQQALAHSYEGLGQYEKATTHYRRLQEVSQQLFDSEKNRQLLDLERKYESEKQERLILEQELALQQKSAQNRLVLALAGFMALIAIVAIGWLRSRLRYSKRLATQQAELQAQRIRDMEQQQQLAAMNAMVEGQEKERHRIARDLHDGLGGLLASLQMHFTALMDEMQQASAKNIGEKTGKMIHEASEEVRRIAHNMMPATLQEGGLAPAIEEMAEGLRRGRNIQVSVQTIGAIGRLSESQELMLYRIVQELLQNIAKHTEATKVIIQLHHHHGQLSLLVEDNGQGFDTASAGEGLGLRSIASRVEYLKGELDIDSVPGEGTTVMVNVPAEASR